MARLNHSFPGQLRLMQMSKTQLFVFVEGIGCDPYFYANVCLAGGADGVNFQVLRANEIGTNSGGKQALLAFFSYLRRKRALVSDFQNKRTLCAFILDKDVDDLFRKRKRSPFVVYTEHYDVQNYVFEHGDLVRGVSAAASVDPRVLASDLGDASAWCGRVAVRWRDWVSLCLLMLAEGINCEANYRVPSRVQTRPSGATDRKLLSSFIRSLAGRAGIPVAQFRRKFALMTKRVDGYFEKGEHHRIFKGKWFAPVLADDVDRMIAGKPYDRGGLSGRLASAVASTLDFSEPWTEELKQSLRAIVAML